jgi:hypothetical protein
MPSFDIKAVISTATEILLIGGQILLKMIFLINLNVL